MNKETATKPVTDDHVLQDLPDCMSRLEMMSPPPATGSNAPPSTPTPTSTDIPPHLSHDPLTNTKNSPPFQFGSRHLTSDTDPYTFNAWDHALPPASHTAHCLAQYTHQRLHPVSAFDAARFNTHPARWWDLFYRQKTTTFFKDRNWLFQEFPILDQVTRPGAGGQVVLEVGAGAGNTAFPIVRRNRNAGLRVHAVDFSATAVEVMRGCEEYDGLTVRADVWDVAAAAAASSSSEDVETGGLPPGLGEGSVDVVIMIFIFSALSPRQWAQAVRNIHRLLKPGGSVLFRDYGRGDLAQVRFKAGRWMEENFYVRGDGTRVYFFEKEELERIWGGDAGEGGGDEPTKTSPRFNILDLDVDRRMIVNRQKKIKMYRCWIQGRFQKPLEPLDDDNDNRIETPD